MAWSDLFTPNAQTTSEAEANYAAQKRRLADQQYNRDLNPIYDYSATSDINNLALSDHLSNKNAAAAAGFVEGLGDGLGNIGKAIKNPFTGLPLWVWGVAAVAALGFFFYLGGGKYLKGILKK